MSHNNGYLFAEAESLVSAAVAASAAAAELQPPAAPLLGSLQDLLLLPVSRIRCIQNHTVLELIVRHIRLATALGLHKRNFEQASNS